MNGENGFEKEFNLSDAASSGTVGAAAAWIGWGLLLVLAGVTAVHAITLVQARTHLTATGGDLLDIVRIGGVVLVELFAVVTAVMLATNKLRAKQKPLAMAVELVWFVFAAVNLISSFAVEAGGPLPAFVDSWITYGLPVSALIMGALFYMMLRLNPDAGRADDEAELMERFEKIKHSARLEVMASPQMKAVIRQMTWQQLPPVVGRQMNLNDQQIAALIHQAPQLLDLNGNGIPDVSEADAGPTTTAAELQRAYELVRAADAAGVGVHHSANGNGAGGAADHRSFRGGGD